MLIALLREGQAVLVSTPFMDEAMRFNRVFFMNHGRVLMRGEPRELMKQLEGRILELGTEDQMTTRQIVLDDLEVDATRLEIIALCAWLLQKGQWSVCPARACWPPDESSYPGTGGHR